MLFHVGMPFLKLGKDYEIGVQIMSGMVRAQCGNPLGRFGKWFRERGVDFVWRPKTIYRSYKEYTIKSTNAITISITVRPASPRKWSGTISLAVH